MLFNYTSPDKIAAPHIELRSPHLKLSPSTPTMLSVVLVMSCPCCFSGYRQSHSRSVVLCLCCFSGYRRSRSRSSRRNGRGRSGSQSASRQRPPCSHSPSHHHTSLSPRASHASPRTSQSPSGARHQSRDRSATESRKRERSRASRSQSPRGQRSQTPVQSASAVKRERRSWTASRSGSRQRPAADDDHRPLISAGPQSFQ